MDRIETLTNGGVGADGGYNIGSRVDAEYGIESRSDSKAVAGD